MPRTSKVHPCTNNLTLKEAEEEVATEVATEAQNQEEPNQALDQEEVRA